MRFKSVELYNVLLELNDTGGTTTKFQNLQKLNSVWNKE